MKICENNGRLLMDFPLTTLAQYFTYFQTILYFFRTQGYHSNQKTTWKHSQGKGRESSHDSAIENFGYYEIEIKFGYNEI